jgi:hypothetical protein
MQYGLITYHNNQRFNVGDYIQALAARQFLPRVDAILNRETLQAYSGPPLKVIMNGWFMHHPQNWPPSSDILPLFLSFHLTPRAAPIILGKERIAYLQRYEVGARDQATLELLHAKGVNAYFSGCLTLTLGNTYRHRGGEAVYFVDVLYKPQFLGRRKHIVNKIFGREIVRSAKRIRHRYQVRDYPSEAARLELADRLLKCYENAKLVVTSRLHCALPCLAMGTPVVYVDVGLAKERVRFDGLTELLHTVEVGRGKVERDFDWANLKNKTLHLGCVGSLEQRCRAFVSQAGRTDE